MARDALGAIERKLRAIYKPYDPRIRPGSHREREDVARELSTSDLVEVLIQDSMKDENLVRGHMFDNIPFSGLEFLQAKMYPGWAAWH